MVTKEEVYKKLVIINKETGQGLSGIVKVMGEDKHLYSKHLEDLIKEGLVKACHTGGSIGHEESNIFYMPTKGYNVWEDDGDDGNYSRHKGRYLTFVRLYLGAIDKISDSPIQPSLTDLLQSPEIMKEYSEWLTRNSEALKEMLSMPDSIPSSGSTSTKGRKKASIFTEAEIEWVKSRTWYKDNLTVKESLKKSIEAIEEGIDEQIKKNIIQLLPLLKQNREKYQDKILEYEKELGEIDSHMGIRLKVNDFLSKQKGKDRIQSVIK